MYIHVNPQFHIYVLRSIAAATADTEYGGASECQARAYTLNSAAMLHIM